ncbi:unnamed protein product [Musa acuminata var. zebrina]
MSHGDGKGDQDLRREKAGGGTEWGMLLFGLLGTTFSVYRLWRTINLFYTQFNRSQSSSSWWKTTNNSNFGGFRDSAWRRYNRRMEEEYEKEKERVERIRRMQNIFYRERDKYKRSYENWRHSGDGAHEYTRHDYWNHKTDTDTSYGYQRTHYKISSSHSGNNSMSHHYSVLGLDWSRPEPYSDAEIKRAFRAKAIKYHPDQNQDIREAAEAKFKELMTSYEAIKTERQNGSPK